MTKDIRHHSNASIIEYRTGIHIIIDNYNDAFDYFLKRQAEHARLEVQAAKWEIFSFGAEGDERIRFRAYSESAKRDAGKVKAEIAEAAQKLISWAKTMQDYGLPVAENIISLAEAATR